MLEVDVATRLGNHAALAAVLDPDVFARQLYNIAKPKKHKARTSVLSQKIKPGMIVSSKTAPKA